MQFPIFAFESWRVLRFITALGRNNVNQVPVTVEIAIRVGIQKRAYYVVEWHALIRE